MSSFVFLQIEYHQKDFYEKPNVFGDAISNSFPSANFDIEEAGKCLALARYTACVMHLQRAMEVGLKAYGVLLGMTSLSNQPSWGEVLRLTGDEIKHRNDKHNPKVWISTEEKEFCEGLHPLLFSVKNAWRNPSMHADAKYTEEEAESIFNTAKGFMKHLANHIDETGTFTP